MITQIIIIALLVLSIHYTMQPDEIFGKLGDWLEDHLPDAVHPAVFACNVCMCPWYGTALYWLIPWHHELWQCPVVVIGAMGVNVVINKWAPEKEAKKENEMIPGNVIDAYDRIAQAGLLQSQVDKKSEWEILFEYHNSIEGNRKLSISCKSCYIKVLSFINYKIKNIGV